MTAPTDDFVTVSGLTLHFGDGPRRRAVLNDISLHVAVDNYGVVEDAHQCLGGARRNEGHLGVHCQEAGSRLRANDQSPRLQ